MFNTSHETESGSVAQTLPPLNSIRTARYRVNCSSTFAPMSKST